MNKIIKASEVQQNAVAPDIIETVMTKGDLAKLSPDDRNRYYLAVCKSIGLNPLTRPLEYINLGGRLVLYARRDAADQLRKINGISIEIVSREESDDLLTIHARARDAGGRQDEDLGVVSFPKTLKGEARANAVLKAITKAKRRVTLSISGLGFLDETEVEDAQAERRPNPHVTRPEDVVDIPPADDPGNIPDGRPTIKVLPKTSTRAEFERAQKEMYAITDETELAQWAKANADRFQIFHPDHKDILRGLFAAHRESLRAKGQPNKESTAIISTTSPGKAMEFIDAQLAQFDNLAVMESYWNDHIAPRIEGWFPPDRDEALAIFQKHEQRLADEAA